jgi:hypothetical protein
MQSECAGPNITFGPKSTAALRTIAHVAKMLLLEVALVRKWGECGSHHCAPPLHQLHVCMTTWAGPKIKGVRSVNFA